MPIAVPITFENAYMGRAEYNTDLLAELTDVCIEQNVTLGRVEAIGALTKARIGYYDQAERTYKYEVFEYPVEITNLTGNVSLKEGEPMVHAHITVSDENGNAYGGHLASGNTVFACEFMVMRFSGRSLQRSFDETTGLPLWDMK